MHFARRYKEVSEHRSGHLVERNLTVFLCGTFADLAEHREAVINAVRKLQLQYETMEFFGARPGLPLDTCLSEVRRSDILVVIVGHRYGSLVPDLGISFSEAEYEEGFRLRKPCLVYMLDDDVPVLLKNIERDPDKLRQLERWKMILQNRHTVARFSDGHDLAVRVVADLARTMQALEQSEGSKSANEFSASDVEQLLSEFEESGISRDRLFSTVRRALRDMAAAANDEKASVFLSYSHADKKIVREVADLLRARGVKVWIDDAELKTGDSLIRKIEHGLDSSDYVAFFISSGSLSSAWAQEELNVAMRRQLSGQRQAVLLPVLLEDVEIPPLLRDVVYLDLRDGDAARAARQLVETINQRPAYDRIAELRAMPRREGNNRAYVLINLARGGDAAQTARSLREIPGVEEVTITLGLTDFVAVLVSEDFQRISAIVQEIQQVRGVAETSTLVGTS